MTMKNHLILLALLCCAAGCAAAGDKQFGCTYDHVAWNSSAMPARIVELENIRGKVKGATMSADAAEWEPIRFTVFTEDLQSDSRYCTASGDKRPTFIAPSDTAICKPEDILTKEKKQILLNDMIPAALRLHSERLLVQPVTGSIIASKYRTGPCGTVRIPDSHFYNGVSNVDMIMYVSAGPTEYPKAWAGTCSIEPYTHRPVVGVMNVGPSMIRTGDNGVRVVAHEIAHALGFDIQNMLSLKMVSAVPNIRGLERLVVSSVKTLDKAKSHYSCNSISGMELENEGREGIIHSHWERRNAKDELMASITEAGYYTALTLSAFESMGYYRGNWGMEETMQWGRNKGCQFLKENCVSNGQTNYPDMFCTDESSTNVCTSDRRGLGKCSLGKSQSLLPDVFQYFNDRTMGGASPFLDFCPVVVQNSITGCKDGNLHYMPGSVVGPNSLCLKGEGLHMKDDTWHLDAVQDICAEILCEANTVKVRYAGNDTWHECPANSYIVPNGSFTGGKIVCPSYTEVCVNITNATVARMMGTIENKVHTVTTIPTPVNYIPIPLKQIHTPHNGNSGTSTRNKLSGSLKTGAESSTNFGAIRNNAKSNENLKPNKPAVSKQSIGKSSTLSGAMVKNGAGDRNSKSTTQSVEVKQVKKNSPVETDVKKPDEILSALPVINGTKMVNPTKFKVDSSQFSNFWCGRFVPICAFLIYLFALCWAF